MDETREVGRLWQPQKNTWASPGSVGRNKRPIANALTSFLESQPSDYDVHRILEIASGFGDHVREFTQDHPSIQFRPTEAQEECLTALKELDLPNVLRPAKLNVLDEGDWMSLSSDEHYDGIICINMIHISPQESTNALFKHAATLLRDNGFILLYGAYLKEDGTFASDGDADFDASLKLRDASFGLRHPEEVNQLAGEYGFRRVSAHLMALNNRLFIWQLARAGTP